MSVVSCRECKKEVSTDAGICPHCGAPRPALAEWKGTGVDWKSKRTVYGYPLIHVAFGRDAKGKFRVAKGVIAVGQFAIGAITFAQFGIGFVFGFGQFILGLTGLAQVAITLLLGVGQIATGYIAVGQLVLAYYGLAQIGLAKHLWSTGMKDPDAVAFFKHLFEKIGFSLTHRL